MKNEQEHIVRKVIRGYAKDKDLNLILIGTIPVPHSKDKRSPVARQDKRYLVRQGATIFKKYSLVASYKRAARADCAAGAAWWPPATRWDNDVVHRSAECPLLADTVAKIPADTSDSLK